MGGSPHYHEILYYLVFLTNLLYDHLLYATCNIACWIFMSFITFPFEIFKIIFVSENGFHQEGRKLAYLQSSRV